MTKNLASYHFYCPQTKFGQGNIFAPVCHSGHVPGHVHPPQPGRQPPQTRYTPSLDQVHPPHQVHLQDQVHPLQEHAGRYGQRAGGTHPTRMQSCLLS